MKRLRRKTLSWPLNKTLSWPLNAIYFIEENARGIEYGNQTGGCACNHPSLRGFLYEFAKNDKTIEAFKPNWWYNLAYQENGALENRYAKKIKVKNFGYYNFIEAPASITDEINRIAHTHPKLITWNKLKKKVGHALNQIKPNDVLKVEILGNFCPPWRYLAEKHLRNEEAWVHARIYLKNGLVKTGVFTWENCD